MRQRDRFVRAEADAFFQRNVAGLSQLSERADEDPVLSLLEKSGVTGKRICELGTGNAWRLRALARRNPKARCFGAEPSGAALHAGRDGDPSLGLARATAEALPFRRDAFDLVVLGFFFYLVDREDLFGVAAEVDRVLADGGHLVIFDFHAARPHRRAYAPSPGCWSYKMDLAAFFEGNPAYHRVGQERAWQGGHVGDPESELAATLLLRDLDRAWPERKDPVGGEGARKIAKGASR